MGGGGMNGVMPGMATAGGKSGMGLWATLRRQAQSHAEAGVRLMAEGDDAAFHTSSISTVTN